LKELDEEKEELRKYQQLDKQRKSLEYAIFSKEVQDAQQKLTEVLLNVISYIIICIISYCWSYWVGSFGDYSFCNVRIVLHLYIIICLYSN